MKAAVDKNKYLQSEMIETSLRSIDYQVESSETCALSLRAITIRSELGPAQVHFSPYCKNIATFQVSSSTDSEDHSIHERSEKIRKEYIEPLSIFV